jgi:hypothetical protein
MSTRPGFGGVALPGTERQLKAEQRAFVRQRVTLRGEIFETPSAKLEAKLQQTAQIYPYLFTEVQVEAATTVDPGLDDVEDDLQDEDEGPEVQGQDGDPYTEDPDPHPGAEANYSHGWSVRWPDLRIRETGPPQARRFDIELGPLPTTLSAAGGSRRRLPEWIIEAIEERAERLLDVGRVIANRQRAFLTAGSRDEALGLLVPLTREEVSRQIGCDEILLGRLIKDKTVEMPRFGLLVPLSLFFGSARAKVPGRAKIPRLRPETLANHIRVIIEKNPGVTWSAPEMREELEGRGLLGKTPDDAIQAVNKRVGRAMKLIK